MPFQFLPSFLVWLVSFATVRELSLRAQYPWSNQSSFLLASVAWGSVVVLITEILSCFKLLQPNILLAAWVGVLIGNVTLYLYLLWRRTRLHISLATLRGILQRQPEQEPLSILEVIMLVIIVLQVVTLSMVAYYYPPNTVDSINYHMARIMHWQQEQSVAFYASDIDMQTFGAPFAEFVLTHLQLLLGNDRFANLVQWFGMIVCAVGVSDIAAKLGADRTRQIIAALLSVSIPMGILQATSTQNDYVVAAWIVCFVALSISLMKEPRSWIWMTGTGLALGLALLTKATAFIYTGLFCLLLAFRLLAKMRWQAIGIGLVVIVLALAVNAGFFLRNIELVGQPIRSSAGYTNTFFSAGVTLSNMIRNTAIHVPAHTEVTPIKNISLFMMNGLRVLHEFTGLSPTDPRTSMTAHNVFLAGPSFHEDVSGNPLHLTLILLTVFVSIVTLVHGDTRAHLIKKGTIGITLYVAILVLIFCLFSFYLKFQIWQSRLQLPHFVLWAPAFAVVLFTSSRKLLLVAPIIVGLAAFSWTFNNETRPISPDAIFSTRRMELYFANRPDLLPVYEQITDAISRSGCHRIGLIIVRDPYEYPIWVLLQERNYPAVIRHIQVTHPSHVYSPPDFEPCAVIAVGENAEFKGRFIAQPFSGFYLYLDPRFVGRPTKSCRYSCGFAGLDQ